MVVHRMARSFCVTECFLRRGVDDSRSDALVDVVTSLDLAGSYELRDLSHSLACLCLVK